MPLVFQYGSNCNECRLNDKSRLGGAAQDVGRAQTIEEYDIAFDVWSQGNRCAASNLIPADGTGQHAWGVLYQLSADALEGLRKIEGKYYVEKMIRIRNEAGEEVEATTFVVKQEARRQGLWTSAAYVGHIVNGLRAHDVPEEYVQHVIDVAVATNNRAGASAAEQTQIEKLRLKPQPSSSTTLRGQRSGSCLSPAGLLSQRSERIPRATHALGRR